MRLPVSPALVAIGVVGLLLLGIFSSAPSVSASTFTAVASGESHTCALTSAGGAVQCWGINDWGQLGIGTTAAPYGQSSAPLPVCASGSWNGTSCSGSAFTGVYVISVGPNAGHTCATIIWGILECWGDNSDGQVGNGTSGNNVLNPAVVVCAGNSATCNSTYHFLAGMTAVATGLRHTCALDQFGYVWCWGHNTSGELGDGTTVGRSIATRVCASGSGQDCPNGTLLSGVSAIAAGKDFSCARTTSGGVKCWGSNTAGQLGDGTTTNRLLPVAVSGLTSGVSALAAGDSHSCALLTTGGVKCWGFNLDGELGDGTEVSKTTPVSVCATGSGTSCTALSGVSKLSAGVGHTCVITTTTPYVKCWGSQAFGQLGNSVQSYESFATNPVSWTTPSWGQPQPTAISVGGLHTCAIISTFVECWGWNAFGQLGNGTASGLLGYTSTWIYQDVDKDGCTDSQELGPNHTLGGQRDPTNFWDFFDTPDGTNTTLSAQVTAAATPPFNITVASASAFPAGPDTLFIDNEKFSYDTKTTTTFHVTARALDGTTSATHNVGAVVIRNVRDKIVNDDDVNRITARFGTNGSPSGDPLAPPPATGYSTAFDRTYIGPNQWNLGPADGKISGFDILQAVHQQNDSCVPPP